MSAGTPVIAWRNGIAVRLSDVANVYDGPEDLRTLEYMRDVCQQGGGAKEHGGNVGACVANAAQKVAVEREKQRR